VKEFKEYFKLTAPGVSEAEVTYSFNTIDTNKDGVISREEFMAAAEDFFCGVEETDLSKIFLGRLVE
jgi:Ca2+-binding EF-hand superfamily protein